MSDVKIVLNEDDSEYVQDYLIRLKENDGYCLCAVEKTPDSKCMCKEFRTQAHNGICGECHCGVYRIVHKKLEV